MIKCSVCGVVAEVVLTPYTVSTPGTALNLCQEHALLHMQNNTTNTFKMTKNGHVYDGLKTRLNDKRGGYVK